MEIKTYRARSMHEALKLVRLELGPDAAVLHTRENRSGRWFGLLGGRTQIEVTASAGVNVPSRLPAAPRGSRPVAAPLPQQPDFGAQLNSLQSMVEDLCRRSGTGRQPDLPDALFRVFTDLLDAGVSETLARELVERVRSKSPGLERANPASIQSRIAQMIETEIRVARPIALRAGQTRVVALVGPTGVGKTTTIAKLAANWRVREKRTVGLITVDTCRIAAVEPLRSYAEIIDVPMEVVASPRQMRDALGRLGGLDLILMDTAGRSPHDEIKIQELKAFLSEAAADEVHLVLSAAASARNLEQSARRFAAVNANALILTKLDETGEWGSLLPLLRASRLPLSYWTDGQNVPDDIEPADAARLARLILAIDRRQPLACTE